AIDESAAITTPAFLARYQLNIGDTVQLVFGNKIVDFRIVEVADYFPTLYPEKGDFFVANLDYLYDQTGLQPYDVWVKVDPNYRSQDIVEAMEKNGIRIVRIRDSRVQVNVGRLDPQRTGLFGVLSIGFIVAALLTVLGFFLYAFLSFQKRMLQMGILRAMGLSVRQLFALLMFEQIYLIALGIAFGTGLGVLTGNLFIPFLQVSSDAATFTTPKFVVQTAWADIEKIYG
ncbi:MAG: ABC transporter permease, partial [Chloroflexota bacterium]